jgi:hypothetical protein
MKTLISFTKFTNVQADLAKSYDVIDGELVKTTNANFYKGGFETIEIEHTELEDFLKKMVPGEFLTQGINEILESGTCPNDARRLKETFTFSKKPGLLVIDSDSLNKFGITSIDALNDDVLIKIEPKLSSIQKFYSTSASSYISFDGENSGLKGVHTFIPINNTLNNAEILDILHVRAVNAGYGYASITKAGSIIIKSPIDLAMKSSNQPIFEGGAILKNAAITQIPIIKKSDGDVLDADFIAKLSKDELNFYAKNVAKLKSFVNQEANTIREEYIKNQTNKIKTQISGIDDFIARTIVKDAINYKLHGEFEITLHDGSKLLVQDILNNKEKYHGVECYGPNGNSSIIYSNQEVPIIRSYDNGGVNYYLHPNFSQSMKDWEFKLLEHVENFNEKHANTIIGEKSKIIRKIQNPLDLYTNSYEFLSHRALAGLYKNTAIQVSEKPSTGGITPILKDYFTAWVNHKNSKVYRDGAIFKPNGLLPDSYFNLWTGYSVDPKEGADLSLLKYHIEHIICQDDNELIKYFYDWCAYSFQHPDKLAGSAIICKGKKGTGKGSIGHFLKNIWGTHGLHISSSKNLVGNFNNHLMNCCFLFCDEAFFANDKANESILKSLITEPVFMIEAKNVNAIQQKNYLKIFMTTNNEYTVPTSHDERRYAVFKVSNEKKGDHQYFKNLSSYLNNKSVQEAFLHEMLNRDISEYYPSNIPNSIGLMEEKYNSLSSAGKFMVDLFENFDGKWSELIKSLDLFSQYSNWFDNSKINHHQKLQLKTFSSYMKNIFIEGKRIDNQRTIFLGDFEMAKQKFENYEQIDLSLI